MSSKIFDLLLFAKYFAFQSKEQGMAIIFDVCCAN